MDMIKQCGERTDEGAKKGRRSRRNDFVWSHFFVLWQFQFFLLRCASWLVFVLMWPPMLPVRTVTRWYVCSFSPLFHSVPAASALVVGFWSLPTIAVSHCFISSPAWRFSQSSPPKIWHHSWCLKDRKLFTVRGPRLLSFSPFPLLSPTLPPHPLPLANTDTSRLGGDR